MSQNHMSEVRTTQHDADLEQRLFTFKATQLIWLALGIVEALIAMRVVLKLIGANPASLFAAFIYNLSDVFLFPFAGLVATPTAGNVALELSSIIAMFVYALLAWGLERILWLIFYRPRLPISVTRTITNAPITPEPDIVIRTTTEE